MHVPSSTQLNTEQFSAANVFLSTTSKKERSYSKKSHKITVSAPQEIVKGIIDKQSVTAVM